VDDYDVFLVQMAGRRVWEVGTRWVSVQEEMGEGGLVEGLDVRVLTGWGEAGEVRRLVLEAGDVLYLPPRVAHCGRALEDYSMTLSVGLRAPSAKDMMRRLVEEVGEVFEGEIAVRYRDPDLLDRISTTTTTTTTDEDCDTTNTNNEENTSSTITPKVKTRAKALLRNAMNELLDSDSFFDSFFGRLATESNRFRADYPPPLDDDEVDHQGTDAARRAVRLMLVGDGSLYAAEGLAWACSEIGGGDGGGGVSRLFVDGRMWELRIDCEEGVDGGGLGEWELVKEMVRRITNHRELDRRMFVRGGGDGNDRVVEDVLQKIVDLLEDLVRQRFLYGSE